MINKEKCLKSYTYLINNQLDKDGFDILDRIIFKGIPQLNREERDLADYVNTLKIQDNKELVELYHHAKAMKYKIGLQKDQTG